MQHIQQEGCGNVACAAASRVAMWHVQLRGGVLMQHVQLQSAWWCSMCGCERDSDVACAAARGAATQRM